MRIKHAIAGFAATVLLCTVGFADDDEGGFSGNVTIASDYSFRGVSQTGLLPAVQGGFDYELDNGFSFGTWASCTRAVSRTWSSRCCRWMNC